MVCIYVSRRLWKFGIHTYCLVDELISCLLKCMPKHRSATQVSNIESFVGYAVVEVAHNVRKMNSKYKCIGQKHHSHCFIIQWVIIPYINVLSMLIANKCFLKFKMNIWTRKL